jgi:hypothetical protein
MPLVILNEKSSGSKLTGAERSKLRKLKKEISGDEITA